MSSPVPGYRQLVRVPGAWAFVLPGFLARQPFAMLGLSILLLVRHTTGSSGTAGVVAAVAGVAVAAGAPLAGRLADRRGQRAVLLPGVLVHAVSGAGLAALALAHAPLVALVAAAVPTGATAPQVGAMVRSRWAAALGDSPLLDTAAAFESVTDELTFVVGPLLATALCTAVHPAAGLVAEALLTVVGGLLFAARAGGPTRQERRAHRSALGTPGVRVLVVAYLGIGTVFGGLQVSLTAVVGPALGGVLYGAFAAGNMTSALAVGALARRASPRARILLGYAALAAAVCGLWLARSALLLAVLSLLAGVCVALPLVSGYALAAVGPARTEAFAWLGSAVALGSAAAAGAAGLLEDGLGAGTGFLAPVAGTGLALVTLLALRSRLVARPLPWA